MTMPHAARPNPRMPPDARVSLAVAVLGPVLACLGRASIAGSAPTAPAAAPAR